MKQIQITDTVHRELKVFAAIEGLNLSAAVGKLLRLLPVKERASQAPNTSRREVRL